LANKLRLPSLFSSGEYVEAGGLMSYAPSRHEIVRRAGSYLDRIFKGAKPAELPVEQPTKIELVINAKTAKALGLAIPQSLLITVDRLIA
jgi:putative ABC transport system substrate-binding protein